MLRVGVIGYGSRVEHLCQQYLSLRRLDQQVSVTAVADPAPMAAARVHQDFPAARMYASLEALLEAGEPLDGVMIGTRCDLHTPLAVRALELGKPIFLEKPVGIDLAQLRTLHAAFAARPTPVVVSFPLRHTLIVQRVREIMESGQIGSVEHVQYLNNVPYGDVYFHDWYRDRSITGGLFLQKATHDFDLIRYLLDEDPSHVCAMTAQRVYGGDKPDELECKECAERAECPESPVQLFQSRFETPEIAEGRRMCCFSRGIANEDCGSALLEYPSGRQVAYSQNFFVKKGAGRRGGLLMGARGTIDFDFYRAGAEIKVLMHHTPREETIGFGLANLPHWGGDLMLMRNFVEVMEGRATSGSPLRAGLMSALTGVQAARSAALRSFQEIGEGMLEGGE